MKYQFTNDDRRKGHARIGFSHLHKPDVVAKRDTTNTNKGRPIYRINKTSKYKGVSWDKRSNRWLACIGTNRKCMNLGYYTSEEEAAKAYDAAAIRYHKKPILNRDLYGEDDL